MHETNKNMLPARLNPGGLHTLSRLDEVSGDIWPRIRFVDLADEEVNPH